MEANKILSADLLDIIFEGKNKKYGAYELRKFYEDRMLKATIVVIAFFSITAIWFMHAQENDIIKNDVFIYDPTFYQIIPDAPKPPEPQKPKVSPPSKPSNQKKFLSNIVVTKENPIKIEKISTIDDEDAIGLVNVISDNKSGKAGDVSDDSTSSITSGPTQNVFTDQIFVKSEIPASFPGGLKAWKKFLENNLNGNIPVDKGAPEGVYTVVVQFVVSTDGSVSDVQTLTEHGFGMEQEAVRVINKVPKWFPGKQNGMHVKSYRSQAITFIVTSNY